jgi:hypothetical protein
MAVRDLQRRGQQIGRLRIGQQVKAAGGKSRPVKLDTFRFTTQSRPSAEAIAELFGGTIRDWEGQFEVITERSAIPVTVPPRDQVVSQWYEMWNKGGAIRRCDSQREQISGGQCQCPHAANPDDPDEADEAARQRSVLASQNPPRACKLVTRISVMIPDLPGLGVFRLDTGSYYAGVEIGDSAALMQMAREKGVFLPAILRIEQRKRVAGGQTKTYPVPVLEVLSTFRQIAGGALEAGGIVAQLPPAPESAKAIGASTPAPAVQPATATSADADDCGEVVHDAEVLGDPNTEPLPDPANAATPAQFAQYLAYAAMDATARTRIEAIAELAEKTGAKGERVCADDDRDEWMSLHAFLQKRWSALPAEGGTA